MTTLRYIYIYHNEASIHPSTEATYCRVPYIKLESPHLSGTLQSSTPDSLVPQKQLLDAGFETVTRWSPMRPEIKHWRLNFCFDASFY